MALRERFVLAVGLLSALVLAGTALAPFSDPELAGRAALARLAAEVNEAATLEWEQMRRSPEVPSTEAVGFGALWSERAPTVEPVSAVDLSPRAASGLNAFSALFAESERAELAGDRDRALELALEALDRADDRGRRAEARLRALQLAVVSSGPERESLAARHLAALTAELEPHEARGDTSYELVATLAALPALAPETARAALLELDRAWFAGELALPGWEARLGEGAAPWLVDVEPDPRRAALRARLDAALSAAGERPVPMRDLVLRRTLALERALGGRPERPEDRVWELRPVGGVLFAFVINGGDQLAGTFVTRTGVVARLAARLRANGALPEGFRVDARGAGPGEVVRARTPLVGDQLGFVLMHDDPEALVRSESRRLKLIRGALLLMALFAAGAGVSTFRALRRERALAELKSSFVASVSHELRTPVASILLMAENLETGRVPDRAAERRYYGLIRREAMRLRSLVDDVLDFSRLERGKGFDVGLEETALEEWARDLREDVADWAERSGADVSFELAAAHGTAALDREALRRALFNLLDNAKKHGGGAPIRATAGCADGSFVLSVTDGGPGIDPRRREEVFQPFARLRGGNGHVAGTGLGLAIVREIAEAHGGTARACDADGGTGVAIEIRVPLSGAGEEVRA